MKTAAEVAREICPGEPLDIGITKAVRILRGHGVETYESCEGGDGHAYDRPTVRFHGSFGAGWHALQVALDHRLPVASLSRYWSIDDGEPAGPVWQMVFRPSVREDVW